MGGSSSKPEIPETMKRIEIEEFSTDMAGLKVRVVEVETPKPSSGQVLVKMAAAPVNPSDYGDWKRKPAEEGEAPQPKPLMGKEGSGVVVASGGGFVANGMVGKRVGVISIKGGTYSEYVVVDAMTGAFPLPDSVATEDAASFFVNPFTACGFVDTVKEMKRTGFVHTAAASQLGQQLVKLCKTQGLTVINVVRREEQAELLRGLGAEHIVVTSEEGWKGQLEGKMRELKIDVIFDAIAGDNTGDMLEVLPPKGTTFVYGGLSQKGCSGINPMDLIYRQKKVEGWLLTFWLKGAGAMSAIMRIRWAQGLVMPALKDGWAASKFEDCAMEEMWPKFLGMWDGGGFTNKKLRIRFSDSKSDCTQ